MAWHSFDDLTFNEESDELHPAPAGADVAAAALHTDVIFPEQVTQL